MGLGPFRGPLKVGSKSKERLKEVRRSEILVAAILKDTLATTAAFCFKIEELGYTDSIITERNKASPCCVLSTVKRKVTVKAFCGGLAQITANTLTDIKSPLGIVS